MNALISSSERPSVIGIILDADDKNADRRLQQIANKIRKYGYDIPTRSENDGTIINSIDTFPKLGIWIMPNNKDEGLIEDF